MTKQEEGKLLYNQSLLDDRHHGCSSRASLMSGPQI